MDTFESTLAALTRLRVDFLVVGGLAVARAGFARMTDHLGLLVEPSRANLARLIGALSTFGDGAASELTPDDFPVEEGAVRVAEDFDIDLFTVVSGQTYADLLPETTSHDVDGVTVRFLGAEALIRLKSASLRPKDRLDAEALRAVQRGEFF